MWRQGGKKGEAGGREKNNSEREKKREKEKRGSACFNFVPGDSKDAVLGWGGGGR